MNKELDIAAILRDKPKGTKLWSPIVGECELGDIDSYSTISVRLNAKIYYGNRALYSMEFDSEGKFGGEFKDNIVEREPTLFPSKEMRDWEKFAWKKGDVLTDGKRHVIFKCWDNNDYTLFFATFEYKSYDSFRQNLVLNTNEFIKSSDNVAKIVIKKVEEHYDGKLNLETLEIEKPKPQFKDGDIVVLDKSKCFRKEIRLFKKILDEQTNIGEYHIGFEVDDNNKLKHPTVNFRASCNTIHLATEEEKQQLFDALAKEGMVWDAEKKAVVDLPKKCEFKPFDKVLSRMSSEYSWRLNIYSHKTKYYHICIDGSSNQYCVPYNEQTAHLLGTTDDWEGGEG